MKDSAYRKCPDCRGDMYQIQIVDKSGKDGHSFLEYTVDPNQAGHWRGKFHIKGQVLSVMCDRCGRIILYGAAYEKK